MKITVRVKSDGKLSEKIPVKRGVRHGDSLNPLLFNLIIHEIIKNIKDKKAYRLGNKAINIICQ
jgi:hypothetical protein